MYSHPDQSTAPDASVRTTDTPILRLRRARMKAESARLEKAGLKIPELWNRGPVRRTVKCRPVTQKTANLPVMQPRRYLNDEQRRVLELVIDEKESVFITGAAGTGKSDLLRQIVVELGRAYRPHEIATTASTGLAAIQIGGRTLHSFAGIGLGDKDVEETIKTLDGRAMKLWREIWVLIIDEVSMISADLFDKLETVARRLRGNGKPFGGIQLIITGDFLQLPPVGPTSTTKYAFQARKWLAAVPHKVILKEVFRQTDDVFTQMLNELRVGIVTQKTKDILKSLQRPLSEPATELFATHEAASESNRAYLNQLPGDEVEFKAEDTGSDDKVLLGEIFDPERVPEVLTLKIGAEVMITRNLDSFFVNRCAGKVIGFKTIEEHEGILDGPAVATEKLPMFSMISPAGDTVRMLVVRETWTAEEPNTGISRTQVPLVLAKALTIRQAQGQTMGYLKIDLSKGWGPGGVYTALSRATSLDSLQVINFNAKAIRADEDVVAFYER